MVMLNLKQKTMKKFDFLVRGSEPQPYEVSFLFDGKDLLASCICRAGITGQHCKHRIDILKGDLSAIVSHNEAEVSGLINVFKNTPLSTALDDLELKEKELKKLQEAVSASKKNIGKLMAGK